MDNINTDRLEINKILSAASERAVLKGGREIVRSLTPSNNLLEVRRRLAVTRECDKLLFTCGIDKIVEFGEVEDCLVRSEKGAVLSCGELLEVAALLRSARCAYESVQPVSDVENIKNLTDGIYYNLTLENDIGQKILSVDGVSDHASEKLFSIRTRIRSLNEKIRASLSEYVSGKNAEYLQDPIVTMRNDRYVIPVKAEHKYRVRGFVHDRSKTGATFFIEPEYVLELNNELIALTIDERDEVELILKELSERVGAMSTQLSKDIKVLSELDASLALADYSYSLRGICPEVNDSGHVHIIKGRHPLIEKERVIPVTVGLGADYQFLLLSGANTGGKTVTLKMIGLFCLMAACGLFIPASDGSCVSVFDSVFCDIGDSQSIEESLSTFSSHITNVIQICNQADRKSLVLIDELGGGTNPDEGQAIAKAVVKRLIDRGCKGVVTTHFTSLKEYAYSMQGIENASMEFDAETLKPLYTIKIGLPGASNALAISRRLGMDEELLNDAISYLSEGARSFENVVRRAEESRIEAERKLSEAASIKKELVNKLQEVNAKIDELNREKERIARSARTESRRIISERTAKAEGILEEMEGIYRKEQITEHDLIHARTLKNKLQNVAFAEEESVKKAVSYIPATSDNLFIGFEVYVKPLDCKGTVLNLNGKGEAEVECGSLKMHLKFKDLLVIGKPAERQEKSKLIKSFPRTAPLLEINLIGMTVGEALYELDNFIDRAVLDNLEEIKVIHGVGTGKLRAAVSEHLKKHRRVESFRLGKYGEGETGVTFVKLK